MKVQKSKRLTQDHIYVNYLDKRGVRDSTIGFPQIFRDALGGMLVSVTTGALLGFLVGPLWGLLVFAVLCLSLALVFIICLTVGHRARCAALLAVRWPFQFAEFL
ncbi:hypothetical protein BG418_27095 [Streptomyces sp. CBMA152]|nr:hypothetical protein [Streptomyces sp. CBMA152]